MNYPYIDPVAFHLGPLAVRWYGMAYAAAFLVIYCLGKKRLRELDTPVMTVKQFEDLLFNLMIGVLIGGRLAYMLFYNFSQLQTDPLSFFKVWQGGMSFHGGLLGVCLVCYLFHRRHKIDMFAMTDFITPMVPIGLMLGRAANFINGELWGRPTHAAWGMIFPWVDQQLRHPSQLYELFFEGIVLFILLAIISRKPRPLGVVSGWFLLLYGVFRFAIEFFRMPDQQLGFVLGHWMTMGQVLTLPMVILGLYLIVSAKFRVDGGLLAEGVQ